jgi:NAD(P)-dependent dehydrogenase (short-subunit alcohol dehydrogenase family)
MSENDPARASAQKIQPLGRMGQASEVAEAAVFLLLETSAWTTGTLFTVDGGVCL